MNAKLAAVADPTPHLKFYFFKIAYIKGDIKKRREKYAI